MHLFNHQAATHAYLRNPLLGAIDAKRGQFALICSRWFAKMRCECAKGIFDKSMA